MRRSNFTIALILILALASCDNAKQDNRFVGTWKAVKLNDREPQSFFNVTLPLTTIASKGYIEQPVKVEEATYQINFRKDGIFEIENDVSIWIRPDLQVSVGSELVNSENLGYVIKSKGNWASMPNHILFTPKEKSFEFVPAESSQLLDMLINKSALDPPLIGQACLYRIRKNGNLILMDNAGIFMEFAKE